jgi:hypothetical protein
MLLEEGLHKSSVFEGSKGLFVSVNLISITVLAQKDFRYFG